MSPLRNLVLALAASHLVGAQATLPGQAALPTCGASCVNAMLTNAAFNCAGNLACLCPKPDFGFGIRDCAVGACGAAVAATFTNWATSVCATATVAAAAVPSTTTTPAPAAVTSTTSKPISPVTLTTSSPIVPAVTSTTIVPSNTLTSTTVASVTTPATTATAATTASSAQSSSVTSSTTTSAAAATSSAAADVPPQPGLTLAAKIGIGVGAGAGAAALLGLLLCILARRRRSSKLPRGGNKGGGGALKISHPMPGGGQVHASPSGQNTAFGASAGAGDRPKGAAQRPAAGDMTELEMNARRYEEMVPRHQPRTMV